MQNKLESLIQNIPVNILKQASFELTERYRAQQKPYLTRYEHYLAYLITRMPATLAVITQVLKTIPTTQIESFLDLGAGPGTGYLAAHKIFPTIKQATLIETDSEFIKLGQQLIDNPVDWQKKHLPCELAAHDLVLMSYSLNEMPDPEAIVTQAFHAAKKILVLIEPGTPEGYQRIIKMRTHLLNMGAHIIAPCPNSLPCPMQGQDWCHFPARVQRSKLHKQLKGGELGYEDEKFSYLIVSREKHSPADARIIAKPELHKGWVELRLCTHGHIEQKKVSAKDKLIYKKARKADWGDEF
ncbi:MAG: small ribosomal subunit Rsm22 family protein [Gammaproteobacteria bacterium]|jgi:ribosomal protein RSM22 (predicted rRNA methylase)